MTDGTEKCNPKIEENQREDRRAFRKFIVLLLAAMVVGGITGAFRPWRQRNRRISAQESQRDFKRSHPMQIL